MTNPTMNALRSTRGMRLPALAVLLLSAILSGPARALDAGAYSMEVLVDGRPLGEYAARRTTYVEASKGHEFAIRLRNRTGARIAVALSVDGLNSIDARTTTARDARKWILDPFETVTISGWQTGSRTARRFFFTTEERSYGAWLGKTGNLGVIAAAVFREKRPEPSPWSGITKPWGGPALPPGADNGRLAGSAAGEARDEAEAAPPSSRSKAVEQRAVSEDLAATGIGRETSHPVIEVEFAAEESPCAVLQVRYEYRDALIRLGVLPEHAPIDDPLARREGARGFREPEFAPDPYR
jgi:hypothetical protein